MVMKNGQETGLYDKKGQPIHIGDWVEVKDGCKGVKWKSEVIFTDGMVTIKTHNAVQVSDNPHDWNHEHDWIDSLWWSLEVGYPEKGRFFTLRKPLAKIAGLLPVETQRKLADKHGHGKRFISALLSKPPVEEKEE